MARVPSDEFLCYLEDYASGQSHETLKRANEILRDAFNRAAARALNKFRVGDEVKFDARSRGIIYGTIVKINPKRVQVKSRDFNMIWNVSPNLLVGMNRPTEEKKQRVLKKLRRSA